MIALELCCGVCAFSTIAFLGLASVSKLRPDLEEEIDADLRLHLPPRRLRRIVEDEVSGTDAANGDPTSLIQSTLRDGSRIIGLTENHGFPRKSQDEQMSPESEVRTLTAPRSRRVGMLGCDT